MPAPANNKKAKKTTTAKVATSKVATKTTKVRKPSAKTKKTVAGKPLKLNSKVVSGNKKPSKATKSIAKPQAKRKQNSAAKPLSKSPKNTQTPRKKIGTKKTVSLPPRMSMRAQEKALVLSEMFEKDFYRTALSLSRVAAVCFIIVGGLLSFVTLHGDTLKSCGSACAAQVGGAAELLPIINQGAITQEPSVTALSTLPAEINTLLEFPLEIQNAEDISTFLEYTDQTGTRKLISLKFDSLGNQKYQVEIRGGALDDSRYTLKVEVRGIGTDRYKTFTVGSFEVSAEQRAVDTTAAPEEVLDQSTPVAIISDQEIREAEFQVDNTPVITLQAPRNASGVIPVNMSGTALVQNVELFVRPVNGVNAQRIGSLGSSETVFRFNTINIPNGTYEIFAKGVKGSEVVRTPETIIEIFNRSAISLADRRAEQERQLLVISRELNSELYENFEPGESVDDSVIGITKERLRTDGVRLDELFMAYAAAQQSGDESLIKIARESIDMYRREVVNTALSDENDRFIAGELDETLEMKLSGLLERVDTFEEIRRERTENDSSIDTDQDGISDIDERVLYQTDPNVADSDGDGFTDGAEISRGFNPLNAEPEAIIEYESPKEAIGVVRTKKLIVKEVRPEIILETASSTEEVHTTVRGIGLPNSFVTLYVFSTPTIVTVRTDAAGGFEYTFTKELEDGQHEVYAVLTGNTGEIIAQSEPFTFIKRARAFTPIEAGASTDEATVVYTEIEEPDNMYPVVIGMSVIALGIVLFLLSISLRANKPEEDIISNDE